MYVEIDFGEPLSLDAVHIERVPDQYQTRLNIDALGADGRWRLLSGAPETAAVELAGELKRAATREMKERGVDYIVLFESDYGYGRVAAGPREWGLSIAGELGGARLYKIE
jgi:hypothetical protein